MLPSSLTRQAELPIFGDDPGVAQREHVRPTNVPFAVGAGLRALLVWGALLGALGVLLMLGHVWVRLKVVEAGYKLSATRQLVERLEVAGRELTVRAAAADTTERLERLATTRLGMRPPRREEEDLLP